MKTFKFRMETVLAQRERTETFAKQSFAEASNALARAEQLLTELQDVRAALLSELCGQAAGFDPMEIRVYQDYMQTITQSIREQERDIRELAIQCEACKLHMVGAAQERQAMDTLKDRDKQAHTLRGQRTEQTVMDELSTARFNFRQREG